MQGWTGAGEGWGLHAEQHAKAVEEAIRAHEAGQKEQHESATAATAAAAGATAEAAAAASSEALNSAFEGMGMTGSEDYLKNVGSFVAAALDPLGIDVKIDIETPEGRKSCHVSRQSSTATTLSTKEATAEATAAVAEDKKEEPEKAVEVEPEPAKKAATPSDDEEDWTVVSDKKDTEEVTRDQSSLYPDLPKTETASAPALEAAEVTQPQVTHPDPRIQVREVFIELCQ